MIGFKKTCQILFISALGILILTSMASQIRAAEICFFDTVSTGGTACVNAPANTTQFGHDTRLIDTGQHKKTGTYLDVEEAKRTKKKWPLGKSSLQNCRFCLEPNAQNAKRLNSLP